MSDVARNFVAAAADSGALVELRSIDGGYRPRPLAVLLGVPLLMGAGSWYFSSGIEPASLLPGASVLTGVLFGLLSLLFNRLKDAVAVPRPDVGADPAYGAHVTFCATAYAAKLSLLITGLLLALVVLPPGGLTRVGVALVIGLFAHLGIKSLFILRLLQAQAREVIGVRRTRPAPRRRRSAAS